MSRQNNSSKMPKFGYSSGIIDPQVYIDTQSNGLASRIVKYSEKNLPTRHNIKPNMFSSVHNKKHLTYNPLKNPMPTVTKLKIAAPDKSVFNVRTRSEIFRNGLAAATATTTTLTPMSLASNSQICRENEPLAPHTNYDSNQIPTRSVLDALKEISRKRIHCEVNDDERVKKSKADIDELAESNIKLMSKRPQPDDNASSPNVSPSLKPSTNKRLCANSNNEFISSLSSSLILMKPKRKMIAHDAELQNSKQQPSKQIRSDVSIDSDCDEPDTRKQKVQASELNKVSTVMQPIKSMPVSVSASLAASKPKITLFNVKHKEPIVKPTNSIKKNDYDDDDDDEVNIPFVKPKQDLPISSSIGKDFMKKFEKSKLALMLSCLNSDDEDDNPDADVVDTPNVTSTNPVSEISTTTNEITTTSAIFSTPKNTDTLKGVESLATTVTSSINSNSILATATPVPASNVLTTKPAIVDELPVSERKGGFVFSPKKAEEKSPPAIQNVVNASASVSQIANVSFPLVQPVNTEVAAKKIEPTVSVNPLSSTSSVISFEKPATSAIQPISFGNQSSSATNIKPNLSTTSSSVPASAFTFGNSSSVVKTPLTFGNKDTVPISVVGGNKEDNSSVPTFGNHSMKPAAVPSFGQFQQTTTATAAPSFGQQQSTAATFSSANVTSAAVSNAPMFGTQAISSAVPTFGSQTTSNSTFTGSSAFPSFGGIQSKFSSPPTTTTVAAPKFGNESQKPASTFGGQSFGTAAAAASPLSFGQIANDNVGTSGSMFSKPSTMQQKAVDSSTVAPQSIFGGGNFKQQQEQQQQQQTPSMFNIQPGPATKPSASSSLSSNLFVSSTADTQANVFANAKIPTAAAAFTFGSKTGTGGTIQHQSTPQQITSSASPFSFGGSSSTGVAATTTPPTNLNSTAAQPSNSFSFQSIPQSKPVFNFDANNPAKPTAFTFGGASNATSSQQPPQQQQQQPPQINPNKSFTFESGQASAIGAAPPFSFGASTNSAAPPSASTNVFGSGSASGSLNFNFGAATHSNIGNNNSANSAASNGEFNFTGSAPSTPNLFNVTPSLSSSPSQMKRTMRQATRRINK